MTIGRAKKDAVLRTRIEGDEYAEIRADAERDGLGISAYTRMALRRLYETRRRERQIEGHAA